MGVENVFAPMPAPAVPVDGGEERDAFLGCEERRGPLGPIGAPRAVQPITYPTVNVGAQAATLVWLVGCCGGAGTSTIRTTVMPEGFTAVESASGQWPLGTVQAPSVVVLVTRTHGRGLAAVRRALGAWHQQEWAATRLAGVVLVADGPKPTRAARAEINAVAGQAPATWSVPWIESWRDLDVDEDHECPRRVRHMTARLARRVEELMKG